MRRERRLETTGRWQHPVLYTQGIQDSEGDIMSDDDEDYELANLMLLIAKCILAMFVVTAIAGLAGFIWGMT